MLGMHRDAWGCSGMHGDAQGCSLVGAKENRPNGWNPKRLPKFSFEKSNQIVFLMNPPANGLEGQNAKRKPP